VNRGKVTCGCGAVDESFGDDIREGGLSEILIFVLAFCRESVFLEPVEEREIVASASEVVLRSV
jgi:hypothetical protein